MRREVNIRLGNYLCGVKVTEILRLKDSATRVTDFA